MYILTAIFFFLHHGTVITGTKMAPPVLSLYSTIRSLL